MIEYVLDVLITCIHGGKVYCTCSLLPKNSLPPGHLLSHIQTWEPASIINVSDLWLRSSSAARRWGSGATRWQLLRDWEAERSCLAHLIPGSSPRQFSAGGVASKSSTLSQTLDKQQL